MTPSGTMIRILQLINTLWFPAAFLYFFRNVAFTGTFNVPNAISSWIDPALSLTAQVLFLPWIWGVIVEVLTDEEPVARLVSYKKNLILGWWIALIILLTPKALHFLIYLLTGQTPLSMNVLTLLTEMTLVCWAAGQLIAIKYLRNPATAQKINTLRMLAGLALATIIFWAIAALFFTAETQVVNNPFLKPIVAILSIQATFLAFAVATNIILKEHSAITQRFSSDKTLILINLAAGGIIIETFTAFLLRSYPPFFAILRALTPPNYRIKEFNRIIWQDYYYQSHALVAISCYTSNCSDAYKLAKEFRKRGSSVVIGGPHVTFFPDEALEFCDTVVIGAAESIWGELIQDYENGTLKKTYKGINSGPEAAKVHQYLLNAPIDIAADCMQIQRGCKFDCHFCSIGALSSKQDTVKTQDETIELLKRIKKERNTITFIDNNMYEKPAEYRELYKAIAPVGIAWAGSASIDIATSDETVRLLKESHCVSLLIGYEIDGLSQEKGIGAKFTMARRYLEFSRKLQKAGIAIKAHFIFGFPGDSWKSLWRMWRFCWQLSPAATVVSFLTPLPGSPHFGETVRKGDMFNLNWRRFDVFTQVIDHPNLGRSWFLQKCFGLIMLFFFGTTSVMGRIFFGLIIVLELIYFHTSG